MVMSRSLSREAAFMLLFEYVVRGDETAEEVYENAEAIPNFKQSPYTRKVFFESIARAEEINAVVDKCLVGWKKERVSFVSRAILMLATYEMMFVDDVPYKVAIDEAVSISKKYDEDKAYSFVNGVLNAVAEQLSLK